jgi:hypothetical protein
MFLQRLPELGPAPRVEGVFGVARYVNVTRETLEVKVNRSSHEFASA